MKRRDFTSDKVNGQGVDETDQVDRDDRKLRAT